MADEKRRAGRDVPFLNWRYILFNWNDSDDEMERRGALAAEIGVDRLCWEITDHPERRLLAPLRARHAGRSTAIRHEIWDDNNLGNAIPGATPRARIEVRAAGARRCRSSRRAGRPLQVTHARPQPVDARRSRRRPRYGRRLVRLGAQLCAADGTLINRDFARAWLPRDARPAATPPTSPIELPALRPAGPLRAEVRSGERRHRLVRALRLGDDDSSRSG